MTIRKPILALYNYIFCLHASKFSTRTNLISPIQKIVNQFFERFPRSHKPCSRILWEQKLRTSLPNAIINIIMIYENGNPFLDLFKLFYVLCVYSVFFNLNFTNFYGYLYEYINV